MANLFLDNDDLKFRFQHLNLNEIIKFREDEFQDSKIYDYAPVNTDDAIESYRLLLEVVGDISANIIEPNAAEVDAEGARF